MNQPLVSISCITYNHAPFIRECLDGFLMQKTNFEFEIIIHDDASTDGTKEIILEYTSKYPKIIFPLLQSENQYSKGLRGMMARFNFPRCKGKYIAICEGDDFWSDDLKLQKQVDFLEENSDFSMCFHNSDRIYEIEEINKIYNVVENKDYSIDELFLRWIAPTSSLIFKKEVVSKISEVALDKRILNGDLIIVLSSFDFGKVRGFKDFMSSYRIHENGISQKRIKEDNLKHLLNYIPHYKLIKEKFPKISKTIFNMKIVDNYLAITLTYLKRKNLLFLKYLSLALYYNPNLLTKALLKPFKRI
jgi:glycosyltransferase involved in cell wall biosynthesis